MPAPPLVVRDVVALHTALNTPPPKTTSPHCRIALVPTMGALHRGHLSLVEAARKSVIAAGDSAKVVVSIYVNPLQFSPDEDFESYPRDLSADCQKLSGLADIVFAPKTLYPCAPTIGVSLPPLADELCGKSRPGFFHGAAGAVSRLFNCIRPDVAVFGLKDFQQAHIIRMMTVQMNYPIAIISAPTVREEDGLAMSSRNAYLTSAERQQSVQLPKALQDAAAAVESGTPPAAAAAAAAVQLQSFGFVVDYVEARDYATMGAPQDDKIIIVAAAVLGTVRLIDNIECNPK